jgi:hypothetical protein
VQQLKRLALGVVIGALVGLSVGVLEKRSRIARDVRQGDYASTYACLLAGGICGALAVIYFSRQK